MTETSTSRDDQIYNTESYRSEELIEAQVYDIYCKFYNKMGEGEEIINLDNYLDRE